MITKEDRNMKYYEIRIGKIFNFDTYNAEPKISIIISEDQYEIIERFADVRKDEFLNEIYKINECEFTIQPHFHKPKV